MGVGYVGYSSDPVQDAARHTDAVAADQDERAREFDYYRQEFIDDLLKRDLNETSNVGRPRPCWSRNVAPITGGAVPLMRVPSIKEVAIESLDYSGGPEIGDLLEYIVADARSGNQSAMRLIERMAHVFAKHRT